MNEHPKTFRPGPLRIGGAHIDRPIVLAPMAGVTDKIYRSLMAKHGAGLVVTEMVSVQGLIRKQPESLNLCVQDIPLSAPLSVQLFGRDPLDTAEAARMVEERGASMVDINAGCPVRKIVRQGAGASLLKEPDRLVSLVEATVKAVRVPVTAKIRIGWDRPSEAVVDLARRLEDAGAAALTVHARTAAQRYGGRADWSWIRRVKEAVSIPVIGNGDVVSPSLAEAMLQETGCDAVMIGRATQGNPWLLSSIASRWGYPVEAGPSPDWPDFRRTVEDHLEAFRKKKPRAVGHIRKLVMWYSRGCPEATAFRSTLPGLGDFEAIMRAFHDWVRSVMETGTPFLPRKVPEMGLVHNGSSF